MDCRKSNRCEHTNIFSVCVLAVQVVHWDYSGRYHGVDPRSGLHTHLCTLSLEVECWLTCEVPSLHKSPKCGWGSCLVSIIIVTVFLCEVASHMWSCVLSETK